MQIEANGPFYDMESKNWDFKTEGERHKGKRELAAQMT